MRLNALLLLLLPALIHCNRSPLVEIEQGKLRGMVTTDWKGGRFYSFLKVPYAKPPVGELRFKDPQPAEKWKGILEANIDMTECVQFTVKKELIGQEDCLYMNIYTPQVTSKSLKPVMVFLHGGAYVEGNGKKDTFGPEFLVPEGVVLVTVQYRLGFFGFLNFENPDVGVPGNAGLKDQNLALKWIRKNIETFGGDPTSVTLFGESVGGASAHMHMLSPLSDGLIHKVISQSGTALSVWNVGTKNTGIHVAKVLEYSTEDEMKVLEYLQSARVEDIMSVQENCSIITTIHKPPLIGPIVETPHNGDIFLSESPEATIAKGKFTKIPFMLGYNSNENLFIYAIDMLLRGELTKIPLNKLIPYSVDVKDAEERKGILNRIKKHYGIKDYQPATEEYDKLLSDIFIAHAVYLTARDHVRVNHRDVYLYKFSADTDLNFIKRMDAVTAKMPGAGHMEELGYLFKNKFTPEDLTKFTTEGKSIQNMVKLWTNFAKYGKPTTKEKELGVMWETFKKDYMRYLDISTDSLSSKVDPFDKSDMHFWDKLLGTDIAYEHSEL